MQTLDFKAGETILTEGESGDTAFLIISGSVEVSVNTGADVKTLGTLVDGDVFGEMSLIDPGPRSATIKAVTPTRCLVTAYDEFIASSQDNPQRALEFMKTLVLSQQRRWKTSTVNCACCFRRIVCKSLRIMPTKPS